MRTTHLPLGPLNCHMVADPHHPPNLLVVLCHGFGAPGDDLLSVAAELTRHLFELAEDVAFIFPEAPLSLVGSGMPGRAWWPIDIARLVDPAGAPTGLQKMRQAAPAGLAAARKMLREMLAAALQRLGLSYSQLVLGGFSQGAMLATDVALRLEEAPAALVILSGTLIDETQWRRRAPMRRGLHVLQSHGTQDAILPYAAAEELRTLLITAELQVEWHSFSQGHVITGHVLERLAARLRSILQAQNNTRAD